MAENRKPIPVPTEETKGFWSACKRHELVFPRCRGCGTYRHYTYLVCPECSSTDWELVRISGRGTIYSYIEVVHPPTPAYKDDVPYNVVLVEMEDAHGLRMMSNLVDFQPQDLKIGTPVEVVFEDITEEITLPKFKPIRQQLGNKPGT